MQNVPGIKIYSHNTCILYHNFGHLSPTACSALEPKGQCNTTEEDH